MAKRSSKPNSAPKPVRRSRAEIDRNFYFGDVLIKTGVAVTVALAAIALITPFTVSEAIENRMFSYLSVMGGFGLIGFGAFIAGRHLRRQATHWDFD